MWLQKLLSLDISPKRGQLVIWILVLALSSLRAGKPGEHDPYWQIREGREFLSGQPLIHPDQWSWAPVGGNVYPNSPAWNVVLSVFYDGFGWPGFFLISLASIVAAFALIIACARTLGAGWAATGIAILATFAITSPILSARAALPAFSLLLLGILLGHRIAVHGSSWSALRLLATMAMLGFTLAFVGNWIHTSWGAITAVQSLAWAILLLGRSRLFSWSWLAGSLGLLAGLALGPYGFEVYRISGEVYQITAGVLIEWASVWIIPDRPYWLPVSLLVVLTSALVVARFAKIVVTTKRLNDRQRLALTLAVMALGLSLAGQWMARFAMASGIFLGPLIAAGIARGAAGKFVLPQRLERLRMALRFRMSETYLRVIVRGVGVVLVVPGLLFGSNLGKPVLADASEYLPEGCNLFASDSAAALLLRPDVKVWMDGRADYWGRERLIDFSKYVLLPQDPPVPEGTTCVLLSRSDRYSELVSRLTADPTWREVPVPNARMWVPSN